MEAVHPMQHEFAALIEKWSAAGISQNNIMQVVLDWFVDNTVSEHAEDGTVLDPDDCRIVMLQDFQYWIQGTG